MGTGAARVAPATPAAPQSIATKGKEREKRILRRFAGTSSRSHRRCRRQRPDARCRRRLRCVAQSGRGGRHRAPVPPSGRPPAAPTPATALGETGCLPPTHPCAPHGACARREVPRQACPAARCCRKSTLNLRALVHCRSRRIAGAGSKNANSHNQGRPLAVRTNRRRIRADSARSYTPTAVRYIADSARSGSGT